MIPVISKQPNLDVSIFAVMSEMARNAGAINLSQGFPDFDVPAELIDLVERHMKLGHNQYAPMPGVPVLREALSKKTGDLYGQAYDPETEITVTAGATEALYAGLTALIRPGDEVIVFEPWYDAYVPVIRYNGGIPKFVQLVYPDFHIDWNLVADTISDRTKAIILNSPHNPTGAVLSPDDIGALRNLLTDTGIALISDEVYEHIVFDGRRHESIARYPDLAERSLVISSFGKTYHTTGWKVGYCLAPEYLTKEFRKVHQFVTYAVNTPVQHAYAEFIQLAEGYEHLAAFYQQKRDLFRNLLSKSRFRLLPCSGTYFQLADYSAISGEGDFEFAKRITEQHNVAVIPTSAFYRVAPEQKIVRFCFAKKDETLEMAAERLCKI